MENNKIQISKSEGCWLLYAGQFKEMYAPNNKTKSFSKAIFYVLDNDLYFCIKNTPTTQTSPHLKFDI